MGPKRARANLQRFLKREVQKRRIKAPKSDPSHPSSSVQSPTARNLFAFQTNRENSAPESPIPSMNTEEECSDDCLTGDPDVNSLFGEPLGTLSIKEQELQAQLQHILATSTPNFPAPKFTESIDLHGLREELKALVCLETDGKTTTRERALIERQKGSLIEEIRYMGEKERVAFEENRTRNKEFPEPTTRGEKLRIKWKKKREERARILSAQPIRAPNRTREQIDDDDELDGEERLRLGKALKKYPLEASGRFGTTRLF